MQERLLAQSPGDVFYFAFTYGTASTREVIKNVSLTVTVEDAREDPGGGTCNITGHECYGIGRKGECAAACGSLGPCHWVESDGP